MTVSETTIPRSRGRGDRGFTLLEVMFAMAILAIALVVVFRSQSQSITMAGISRFETTASLLAQGKMAEMEAMDPDTISAGTGDFGDDFPDYSWKVAVSETGTKTLKKIEVTVTNEKMAANGSFTIVLCRYAAQQ